MPKCSIANTIKVVFAFLCGISLGLLLYSPVTFSLVFLIFIIIWFLSKHLDIGLYLLVFFTPITYFALNLDFLRINFGIIINLLLLSAFFLNRSFLFFSGKKSECLIKLPLAVPFGLFLFSSFISSAFSSDIPYSVFYVVRIILGFYLFYIFLPLNIITTKKILKRTLLVFSFVVVALSAVSLSSFFVNVQADEFYRIKILNSESQQFLINYLSFKFGNLLYVFPYLNEQNLLVESLLPGLFIFFSVKIFYHDYRFLRFINIIILLIVLVLVGTFSRGAWISFMCTLAVYLAYYYRFKLRKILTIVFLILLFLSPFYWHMYNIQTKYNMPSTESRILSLNIASNSFKEHFLIGTGPGSFEGLIGNNIQFSANYGDPVDALGVWQKIAVENGIFGILCFGFLLFHIINKFIFGFKSASDIVKYELLLPLMAASLSIFIFEFFNTSYYGGRLWLPIAITLAASDLAVKNQIYEKKD